MKRTSAPSYDLFKLIVAIVLVVILLLMLLRGCATITAAPLPTETSAVTEPVAPAASDTASPEPTDAEAIPPTDTPEPLEPSPTPTALEPGPTPVTDEATVSPTPTVTESSEAVTETATPAGEESTSCNTSMPSRLAVGQTARVVQRLNMRSQASITAPILQTNAVNTQVEIIGGPVCTPVGERAYLWWQVRLANGAEGWSAESPLNEASYLLEPVP